MSKIFIEMNDGEYILLLPTAQVYLNNCPIT